MTGQVPINDCISLVVSTYENPRGLALVMAAVSRQTLHPGEVLVADDGSGPGTAAVLADFGGRLPLVHIRQEHDGPRKSRILNRAVLAATGEYLIFLDGDCIPRSDFISAHAACRRPGYFVSGGIVRLDAARTASVNVEWISSGAIDRPDSLNLLGVEGPLPAKSHYASSRLPFGMRRRWPFAHVRGSFYGGNSSAWRSDIIGVNGFDETLSWGHEDSDLGVRLRNAGVKPLHVRYAAVCFHLDHERPYRDQAVLDRNAGIVQERLHSGRTRAEVGIEELARQSP